MSGEQVSKETKMNDTQQEEQGTAVGMEAYNRIAKLPVVESTINAATNMYEKVKDSNSYINWTLSTAESTVNSAVEKITPLATPVAARFEGPIKKVDSMICTGLDYVETKVPCVKLPPGEMYENTKNYINDTVTPAVQSARNVVEPAVQSAKNVIDPAVQTARNVIDPAMQTAKNVIDPAVQQAYQVKDQCVSKVGEYLGKNKDAANGEAKDECKTCEKDKCEKPQ